MNEKTCQNLIYSLPVLCIMSITTIEELFNYPLYHEFILYYGLLFLLLYVTLVFGKSDNFHRKRLVQGYYGIGIASIIIGCLWAEPFLMISLWITYLILQFIFTLFLISLWQNNLAKWKEEEKSV